MRHDNRKRGISSNIIRALSKSGFCSRSQALQLVCSRVVTVNGKVVTDPGYRTGGKDDIRVRGQRLRKSEKRCILLNKPAGYVTTRSDEHGRPTVYELLKDVKGWVFPVGRLDRDSRGLLVFTNDTRFGDLLTDPVYAIEKVYEVTIGGLLGEDDLGIIRKGVDIGRGDVARPKSVSILAAGERETLLKVVLTEGKNREIRRLFEKIGVSVIDLKRISFGPFLLGSLPEGTWREVEGTLFDSIRERIARAA